ncbi:MAG: hypothetical protein MZV70_21020 [Desulfobacterales bacterium]|nr:hypothetical protein [Desulfobacterales bacterium]
MKETVPDGGEGEQGYPHRRRHLAAPASGRPHQDALHELAVRRHHRPACPSSPRRAWARESNTRDHRRRDRRRTPPACSTRWAAPPAASRCTWTRASSSTSTT